MSSSVSKKERINAIEIATGMRTAILVDGAFFIRRYWNIYGHTFNAKKVAKDFYTIVLGHVEGKSLYRILFYDCYPSDKKIHTPISKKLLNYSKTKRSKFQLELFEELKKMRKVALRLGYLQDGAKWIIKEKVLKTLLSKAITVDDLKDEDFKYDFRQKGIDMKIGTDIASLSYKRLVQQIVLISGDSDFVPAAKVARREGIDFILDPMWSHIQPSLSEHIDGLRSTCKKPTS